MERRWNRWIALLFVRHRAIRLFTLMRTIDPNQKV